VLLSCAWCHPCISHQEWLACFGRGIQVWQLPGSGWCYQLYSCHMQLRKWLVLRNVISQQLDAPLSHW
jgi:hypothetical protein